MVIDFVLSNFSCFVKWWNISRPQVVNTQRTVHFGSGRRQTKLLGPLSSGTLTSTGSARRFRIGRDVRIYSSTRLCLVPALSDSATLSVVYQCLMAHSRQCCSSCWESPKWFRAALVDIYFDYYCDVWRWIVLNFFTAWSLKLFVTFFTYVLYTDTYTSIYMLNHSVTSLISKEELYHLEKTWW